MARRTPTSASSSALTLFPEGDGDSPRIPPASARPLQAEDRRAADRHRIHLLAERFAADWGQPQAVVQMSAPDARRAAAADPAESLPAVSPETVKRLAQAIQEIIDWIATQICMIELGSIHVRRRPWPDLDHEAHLAKRAGLTRDEWTRLLRLLLAEASLPIVGHRVPDGSSTASCWRPEPASLLAWSKGWDWSIVIQNAKLRMAG